jgi:exodeoxyribonuclease-5
MTVRNKKKKSIVDTAILNSDQRDAFEKLRDFITDPDDDSVYVLKGWAGTGKTFCISVLVRYVLDVIHPTHAWYKIAVTGPTNKSVRVIKKTSGLRNPRVTFQTIHKLLGLTEKITMDGQQVFVNQESNFKPQITQMRLLIIDEVSMLNDDLFHDILAYRGRLKIICMGDPAQIPPVGKPDCIPFREELSDAYGIKTIQLRKIMRQKEGNSIIDSSVKIRKNLESEVNPIEPVSHINEKGEGVEFLNLNSAEMRREFPEILARYFKSDRFKEDSEYCKIISWRNKTVASMNNLVRRIIFGEEMCSNKILVGEKLIANSPIIIHDNIILFNTNDEFSVEKIEVKEKNFNLKEFTPPMVAKIKYYEATVNYINDQDEVERCDIEIIHEDSEVEFQKISLLLKNRAIANGGKDRSWLSYYKFIRIFADVSFGYSITAHKAQGSTYDTTFVLEDDIDMNLNIVERNRIKYTSYTRSSRKVYVLKRF